MFVVGGNVKWIFDEKYSRESKTVPSEFLGVFLGLHT